MGWMDGWRDRLGMRIIDRPFHPLSAVLNFLHGSFPCLWDANRGSVAPLSVYPSVYLAYRFLILLPVYQCLYLIDTVAWCIFLS
ncbi:hypothetical protein BDW42DRAFT_158316, partial [Aspergillus taichungensis]